MGCSLNRKGHMSNRSHQSRMRRIGLAVAAVLALGIVPAAAQAAPVNLATASPFVVLGGAAVTNTGPSVLKGGLGVSPGTSLTGVAGSQAVSPGNELTGIDLGGLSLTPGAYSYSSSAQLTGQLTLNAQGNPNAQFVFIVGSTLTTASASSVNLINGASPCNVYWRIGSSATFGTGTQFEGNVLAHEDISVNDAVHVDGRLLAAGAVTLINDVLDNSQCEAATETGSTETGTTTTSTPVTPTTGTTAPTGTVTPTGKATTPKPGSHLANGGTKTTPKATPKATSAGSSTVTHGTPGPNGTTVTVAGKKIAKIVVSVDNKTVKTASAPSLKMTVSGTPGTHTVTVRVSYKDKTQAKTTTFRIHVPSAAPLHPNHGPSKFTG
jgi:hypothetical protein